MSLPLLDAGPPTSERSLIDRTKRIVAALRAAGSELEGSPPALHDAICEFVRILKTEGVPQDDVVTLLNAALTESQVLEDPGTRAELKAEIVARCLESYYRTATP